MTSFEEKRQCRELEAVFGAVFSGDATPEENRICRQHLEKCPECAREFFELKEFRSRLVGAYSAGESRPKRRGLKTWLGLAAAASLVAALTVGRPDPQTSGAVVVAVRTAEAEPVALPEASLETLTDEEMLLIIPEERMWEIYDSLEEAKEGA